MRLVPSKDGRGGVVGIPESLPIPLNTEVCEQAGTRDVEKLREGHPYALRILWEVGYPVDGKEGNHELQDQPERNQDKSYENSQEERCRSHSTGSG